MTTSEQRVFGNHYATSYNGSGAGLSANTTPRNTLVNGTANFVLINDNAGVVSQEATLDTSRGGTGVNLSAVVGPSLLSVTSGVVASTLTYGTTNTPNSLVQRDGSGNIPLTSTSMIPNVGSSVTTLSAYVQTTNATPTTLYSLVTDQGTGANGNTYLVVCKVVCCDATATGASNSAFDFMFKVKVLKSNGNVVASNISNITSIVDNTLGLLFSNISVAVVNTSVNIRVTGIAATTFNWVGKIDIVQTTF